MPISTPPIRSQVLRASRRSDGRLPHPSWRAATREYNEDGARIQTADDFWSRLGL